MSEIFTKLGIEWKLLLSQGINFLVLLVVLTFVVYRPLLAVLKERKKKIEFGLQGAEEAKRRLAEIDIERESELGKAREAAYGIITEAETAASVRVGEILSDTQKKATALLEEAAVVSERKKVQELEALSAQAGTLIKEAIIAAVNLDPVKIDEAIIQKAASSIKAKIS